MDWLVLLASASVILAPVVLLFGFSGCTLDSAGSPCTGDGDCPPGSHCTESGLCIPDSALPPAPQNLSAVATSDHAVLLTWDPDPSASGFLIERAAEDGPFGPVSASPDPAGTTDDKGLVEGTTFIYRVTALIGQTASPPSNMSSATVFPLTPTDLVATPVGPDEIDLSWTNASAAASEFRVEDTTSTPPRLVYQGSPTSCKDTGLSEGSQHDYQVFATVPNGFQNSVGQPVDSSPALVSATTFSSFTPAFTAPGSPSTDQPGVEGFCIVQRISAGLLTAGGTQVRVVVRGSTTGSLTLDGVTISQVAAGATSDPYDSGADLATVSGAVTLPATTSQLLGPVDYALDPTKDLLVAFDVSAAPGQGNVRFIPVAGADSYARGGTTEAAVEDRTAGYTLASGILYLIEKIEVL